MAEGAIQHCQLFGVSTVSVNVSFLLPSVISIVVLTIHFLISFLCPVNCPYSKIKTCDLCLCASNSPLDPTAGEGERREGENTSVNWRASVGALN